MLYDFITIGAGASGLFFTSSDIFKTKKLKGLLLEKTKHLGTKLLMSGSGQCNITHAGNIKDFVPCYGSKGKKIRSSLFKYNNQELVKFLKENSIKTIVREDGKIFPASMKAQDILDMLISKTRKNGFEIQSGIEIVSIEKQDADKWLLRDSNGSTYLTRNVVIATGGCSYPTTGSDGKMFDTISRDLSVEISELRPSLSSIQIEDYKYAELSGISFKSVRVQILPPPSIGGKAKADNINDLLFTHKDLSGPAILNISKYADAGDVLSINYLYPVNYDEALKLLKEKTAGSSTDLHNILAANFNLPKRFCKIICNEYGPSIKKIASALTGEANIIKSVSGFKTAMATSGGVAISEINTKTMELKKHPGIFLIGEACDIDGITGGYNLQFAFSSARTAAESIL